MVRTNQVCHRGPAAPPVSTLAKPPVAEARSLDRPRPFLALLPLDVLFRVVDLLSNSSLAPQ